MRCSVVGVLSLLAGCAGPADPSADAPRPLFNQDASPELIGELAQDQLSPPDALPGLDGTRHELLRAHVDPTGTAHAHYQQLIDDVPVFGGEIIVHVSADGRPEGTTDHRLYDLAVDTVPAVDAQTALDRAVELRTDALPLTADPELDLWVVRHDDVDRLTWRVALRRIDGTEHTTMPVVFVDAHTSEIVWSYDNLQTASGTSPYNGTVSFNSYKSGSNWYLEDTSAKLGTYTYGNSTTSLSYVTDTNDVWTDTADRQAVGAHWAATRTLDYYSSDHGRNGINGSNGPGYISSLTGSGRVQSVLVNYGRSYNNAFWDGSKIVIGDGDGSSFGPLGSLDIVAHELTHGVITSEANLTYANQSGALNESYADVFGALVELDALGSGSKRWWIGEDCWTPGTSGDALRYMDDPTADGSSRDHYSTRYVGTADSGGVHWNSGIPNLAFYLLVNGGSHPKSSKSVTTVTGISAGDAADIWYLALTSYMTSSTNFAQARTATLSAAASLYGSSSTQYTSVQDAWAEVGVGSPSSTTTGSSGCSGYTTNSTGSLSGTGSSAVEPGGTYYYAGSGTHAGCLSGPSSADFDLELYRWNGSGWSKMASSTSSTSSETISYAGSAGYYYWKVLSYSGSGGYDFGLTKP
ncbi:MAG: M4 family metallopeptidase [Myxococcota bacterium]